MAKSWFKHFVMNSILALVLGSCNSQVANFPTATFTATAMEPVTPTFPPAQTSTSTPPSTQVPTLISTELPEPTPDPAAFLLDSFQMMSETVGWGTATLPDSQGEIWTHRILYTSDGGLNWQDVTPQYIEVYSSPFLDFSFLDGDHAWVATVTPSAADASQYILSIWRTYDGGQTWELKQANLPHSLYPQTMSVAFEDDEHGSAWFAIDVAAGTTWIKPFQTSDGGVHWQELPLETVTGYDVRPPEGFPQGFGGADFNYMACWNYRQSQTFFSTQEGIFQVSCNSELFIYHTYDGGQTWDTPAHYPGYLHFTLVDFVDMNNGWYVANVDSPANTKGAAFYVTHDGGRTSEEIIPVIDGIETCYVNSEAEVLTDSDFMDPKVGWSIVGCEDYEYSMMLKTTDGGFTWAAWVPHLQPAK